MLRPTRAGVADLQASGAAVGASKSRFHARPQMLPIHVGSWLNQQEVLSFHILDFFFFLVLVFLIPNQTQPTPNTLLRFSSYFLTIFYLFEIFENRRRSKKIKGIQVDDFQNHWICFLCSFIYFGLFVTIKMCCYFSKILGLQSRQVTGFELYFDKSSMTLVFFLYS